jgi:hypothetical protein
MTTKRPIGVIVLAALAALGTIVAIIHALQVLQLLPIPVGPVRIFTFDPLVAVFWGILAAIYFWLVRGLWLLERQAGLFLVILSIFSLALALVSIIGNSSMQAMAPSVVLSGTTLAYCILPSTKRAFGAP